MSDNLRRLVTRLLVTRIPFWCTDLGKRLLLHKLMTQKWAEVEWIMYIRSVQWL